MSRKSLVGERAARRALLERLARKAGYQSLSAASTAAFGHHTYFTNFLLGKGGAASKVQRGADFLGVTPDTLERIRAARIDQATAIVDGIERGEASEVVRLNVRSGAALPVRYVVQAGAWFEVDEAAQERIASPPVAADPSYPNDVQWLELVRGDSADLFYPEGSFVHVVDAVAIGYAPQHEDFVVIERRRQQGGLIERSLKQIAVKRRKIELWPRSRNPRWNAPLDLRPDESEDEAVVEISALVIGGYLPARRR